MNIRSLAQQALDDALGRRLNHLADVYFLAIAEPEAILRFMHGLELAHRDYSKAKQAIEEAAFTDEAS